MTADFFLENYSKPPMRAAKTHEANERCIKHVKAAFGTSRLVDITADSIDLYLRERLRQRVRIKAKLGYKQRGAIKATTIRQEFRVLRRTLNVAVRKKLLTANPCSGAEFPVAVKGLFRPHYVTWSEQERIESHAPQYLRNVIRNRHGDRVANLQGTDSNEEGPSGSTECGGLDTGFKDSERYRRGSSHFARR
jgi:hypothetical protein